LSNIKVLRDYRGLHIEVAGFTLVAGDMKSIHRTKHQGWGNRLFRWKGTHMSRFTHVVAVILLGLTSSLANAADPIKLGFIYVMSGPVALQGSIASQGAKLAISEINNSGGILGRKIEAVFEDSRGDVARAAELFKKLVREDKVDAAMGVILSPVAIGLMPVVKEEKTPLIITTAATPKVTGSACNRYTFRVGWSSDQYLRGGALVAATTKAKKWTTIGPDNALGRESWDLFQRHLRTKNPEVKFASPSEVQFASTSTFDWSDQIKNLLKSDADGVLVTLFADQFVGFVRQAQTMGLFDGKREWLSTVAAMNNLIALGGDAPIGMWLIVPYWHSIETQANKAFVEAYLKQFRSVPAYVAQFAYAGVKAYAEVVRQIGTTDKEAVVKALEDLTFEAPLGPITIRREDHQAIHAGFAGRISEKREMTLNKRVVRSLGATIVLPADEVATPVAETGCNMP
jgi:branched-chain amino acid transport system substrate-binding protein